MARVKKGLNSHKRRKKTLKLARGFYGAASRHYRVAKTEVMRANRFAFVGRKQKKNQKTIELKEMRLSATIDDHDLETKAKNVQKFLNGGDKVKISIRFRGRQLAHTETGLNVMNRFVELLDNVVVEKSANMEGRNMFMVLAPKN